MHKVALLTLGVFYLISAAFSKAHTNDIATALTSFSGLHDKVLQLPNVAADVMAEQQIFAGYLNVSTTKNIHYYFVESKRGASSIDPLLLFLGGGISNSGLSYAFGVGGPLTINSDMTITSNPYSWNRRTNVLYIDVPAGSGYSYDTGKNYNFNDQTVAEENFKTLQQFYAKFPYMKQRKLIILGQSYSGTHAATLSKTIVDWNKQQHSPEDQIKLTTIAVANGVNQFSDYVFPQVNKVYKLGIPPKFFVGFRLLDVNNTCDIVNEDNKWNGRFPDEFDSVCQQFHFLMQQEVLFHYQEQQISIHDISKNCKSTWDQTKKKINENMNNYHQVGIQQPPPATQSLFCLDNDARNNYFNRNDVKQALHVPSEANWADVRTTLNSKENNDRSTNNIPVFNYNNIKNLRASPIWKDLLKNGIRGVLYHGLNDIWNPAIATSLFEEALHLPVLEKRKDWHYVDGTTGGLTVGGTVVQYQNLTSILVQGEGNVVGLNVPETSQKIIEHYILQDNE